MLVEPDFSFYVPVFPEDGLGGPSDTVESHCEQLVSLANTLLALGAIGTATRDAALRKKDEVAAALACAPQRLDALPDDTLTVAQTCVLRARAAYFVQHRTVASLLRHGAVGEALRCALRFLRGVTRYAARAAASGACSPPDAAAWAALESDAALWVADALVRPVIRGELVLEDTQTDDVYYRPLFPKGSADEEALTKSVGGAFAALLQIQPPSCWKNASEKEEALRVSQACLAAERARALRRGGGRKAAAAPAASQQPQPRRSPEDEAAAAAKADATMEALIAEEAAAKEEKAEAAAGKRGSGAARRAWSAWRRLEEAGGGWTRLDTLGFGR